MTWYAAHIIIGMKRRDGKGPISVHENVFLIEAETFDEAGRIASSEGEQQASLDDGLTVDGAPADYIFAGVRKIITVSNPDPLDQTKDRPATGTEITYSEFEVPDEADLRRLGQGETLDIRYIECRRMM